MKRKWLGLLSLTPATAMVFTDQAVLPVALPTIQSHLGASTGELWWTINSYLLVSAVLLLAGGKLGDRMGHRKVFLWGIWIFAISSLLCGTALNIGSLIGARALQGVGAALMIPAISPILMSLFPQSERGKAIGISISISSLFLVLAPFIGGYFTEVLSWRWIFYINLPLAAIGLLLTHRFIPPSVPTHQKFDPWGFSFFAIFSTIFITLIMEGNDLDWTSFSTIALSIACLLSAFFLFWREKKSPHPFIDLSLFRHPIYKAVNISVFSIQFILMITIYRAIFFQEGLDWSPLKTGTISCLTSLPMLFMSTVGGWLADRFGPKLPIAVGFSMLIFSFFYLAFFIQDSLAIILPSLFAFSLGIPLVFTPSYSSAMGAVPQKKAGLAFGVLATMRGISASLGVAVIGAFVHYVQLKSFTSLAQENSQTDSFSPSFLKELSAGVSHAHETLSSTQAGIVQTLLQQAQFDAFFAIHLMMGFGLMIAFALVFVLYRRKASHHLPETPAEGWD